MAEITFSPAACYTLLSILVVIVLLKLRSLFTSQHAAGLNLPPGPRQLPVIGNMHCLLGALPHHAMRRLAQRYGPVMLLRLGHVRAVVVSSPEAAREVLKTHDAIFANRPLYVTMGIFTYGGQDIAFAPSGSWHWKEVQRLCVTELLGSKRVLSFRPIREEEVTSLVRSVAVTSPAAIVNVSERIKVLMNDILMRCAIGDRCPMRDEYLAELDKALDLMAGFNLIDLFPGSRLARTLGAGSLRAAREVHDRIHRITQAIIEYHESSRGAAGAAATDDDGRREDILGLLLGFQKDAALGNTFTTEFLSGVLFDVFAAGSETTATTTIWVMSELVRNPAVMQRAQSEVRQLVQGEARLLAEEDIQGKLPYLQMVIKETLRLHPPAPLILPRLSAESTKVLGFDVPEGTTVFVNAWALGRDENSWGADAHKFEPERFEDGKVDFGGTDFRFVPGGSGRRMCPGLTFGLANVETTLASLLYHFDWKLPGGANPCELDMAETYGITARRKTDLLLEATPYVPHGSES